MEKRKVNSALLPKKPTKQKQVIFQCGKTVNEIWERKPKYLERGVSKPQKTDLKWTETSEPLISPGNQVLMSRFKCYFSNWLFSEISNN